MGLVVAAGAFATRPLVDLVRSLKSCRPSPRHLVWLALLAPALLVALTPPRATDELSYHLLVPGRSLAVGHLVSPEGNLYARFPMAIEMLYVDFLAVGADRACHLLHLGFALLAAAAVAALVRRLAPGTTPLALAVYASLPSLLVVAGQAYVDLALSAAVSVGLLALVAWEERPTAAWAVMVGVACGFASATKYTGLVYAGLVGVPLVALALVRRLPRHAALAAGLGFAIAAPWYLRNLVQLGNPVYPFAWKLFGGSGLDAARVHTFAAYLADFGSGRTGLGRLLLPIDLVRLARHDSPVFDGLVGPLLLALAPLAFLGLGDRRSKTLAAGTALAILAWALGTQQVRFLFPILPAYAVLVAAGYARLKSPLSRGVVQLTAALGLSLALVDATALGMEAGPVAYLVGSESRRDFLLRTLDSYAITAAANRTVPGDGHILAAYLRAAHYYFEPEVTSFAIDEAHALRVVLAGQPQTDEVARRFRAMGYTHLVFRSDWIFGRWSSLPLDQRAALANFLRDRATLLAEAPGGYSLYSLP